jgi:hypothetical protein
MNRNIIGTSIWLCLSLIIIGCNGTPPVKAGKGTLYGTVIAVPREGIKPGKKGGGPYKDPRFGDVEFVDYRRPGFVVVYLDTAPAQKGEATITIKESNGRVRLSPANGAVGLGNKIVVSNETSSTQVVSCPDAEFMQSVEAGQTLSIETKEAGPLTVFTFSNDKSKSTVFVSPGVFSVASGSGSWELRDLDPKNGTLKAWHPRFPQASKSVSVKKGESQEIELQLRVENLKQK